MSTLSVTAVMAVYNGERFVAQALGSMLQQTCPPEQIIVVDDGSTDGTADVLSGYPSVEVLRQPNAGQAAALNRGVRYSRGELLCFLDADDLWTPDKLELQLAAFASNPRLDVVFGHAVQFREGEDHASPPQSAPTHGAMLVRAESFRRVGDFDTSYRLGAVFDWLARAQDAGLRSLTLDAVVLRRRIHGANIGITRKNDRVEYLRAVKAALDRRRCSPES